MADEGKTIHWTDRQTYSILWLGILTHASNSAIKAGSHENAAYIAAIDSLYYSLFKPQRDLIDKWKKENENWTYPQLQMAITDLLYKEGWFTKDVKILRGQEWLDRE